MRQNNPSQRKIKPIRLLGRAQGLKAYSILLIICLLFSSYQSHAAITSVKYCDASGATPVPTPTVGICGGPIFLLITNDNTPGGVTFPIRLDATLSGTGITTSDLAVSSTTVSPPGGPTLAATTSLVSNTFQITINTSPTGGGTLAPGGTVICTLNIKPNCSLIQLGASNNYSFNNNLGTSVTATTNFAVKNTAGTSTYATLSSSMTINYPILAPSFPTQAQVATSGCNTNINIYLLAANYQLPTSGLNAGVLTQDFSSLSTPMGSQYYIYRPITISNQGADFSFSGGTSTIKVTDNMSSSGVKVFDIVDCNGNSLVTGYGATISNPTTTQNVINIGQAAFNHLSANPPAYTGPFPGSSATSITFYEKIGLVPVSGVVTVCGQTVSSSIWCEWICGTNASQTPNNQGVCGRMITTANIIYPNLNANLQATFSRTVGGYCYNGSNANTNTMDIVNNGNTAATNINFFFESSAYGMSATNGWTDYDFSSASNATILITGVNGSAAQHLSALVTAGSLAVTNADLVNPLPAANPSCPISQPANQKVITFTFTSTGANAITIPPGGHMTLVWQSRNYSPPVTVPVCANSYDPCSSNTLDDWGWVGYYGGTCNQATNNVIWRPGANTSNAWLPPYTPYTIVPQNATAMGTSNMIGDGTISPQLTGYGSALGQATFILPNNIYNSSNSNPTTLYNFWPYQNSNLSYIVRFELGTDLNIYNGTASANLLSAIKFLVNGSTPITPAGISYVNNNYGSNQASTGLHGANARDYIEAKFDVGVGGFTATMLNQMIITLNLSPECTLSGDAGADPVSISIYEVSNNSTACTGNPAGTNYNDNAAAFGALTDRVPLLCNSTLNIQVQCPGCHIAGLYAETFGVARTTYGLADNSDQGDANPNTGSPAVNCNGVPGHAWPIVFNSLPNSGDKTAGFSVQANGHDIYADRGKMMLYDVFKVRTVGLFHADAGYTPTYTQVPALNSGMPYIYARIKFGNNSLPTGSTAAQRAAIANSVAPYGNPKMRIWDGGSNTWSAEYSLPVGTAAVPTPILIAATGEWWYKLDVNLLKQSNGGPLPNSFALTNNVRILLDFDYQVVQNAPYIGSATQVDVYTTVYTGTVGTEDPNTLSSWLVDMAEDNNANVGGGLNSSAIFPYYEYGANITGDYYYDAFYPGCNVCATACAGCPNIALNGYDNIRYYCVHGEATIKLVGFDWAFADFTNPPVNYGYLNNSCSAYFASDNVNYSNHVLGANQGYRGLNLSGTTLGVNDAFPYEYRNWVKYNKLEIIAPATGGSLPPGSVLAQTQNPGGNVSRNYVNDDGPPSITYYNFGPSNLGYIPANYFGTPLTVSYAPNSFFDNFNTGSNKYIMPDDAFYNTETYCLNFSCMTAPSYPVIIRETDDFRSDDPMGKSIAELPGGQIASNPNSVVMAAAGVTVTPPTAGSLAPNQKYKDNLVTIKNPAWNLSYTTNLPAVASCGIATWTSAITITNSAPLGFTVVNPWIGFDPATANNAPTGSGITPSATLMNITGVTLNGVAMTYDTRLGIWRFPTVGAGGSYTASNTVNITASYCVNNGPSLPSPKIYAGTLCNAEGILASLAVGQNLSINGTPSNNTPANNDLLQVVCHTPVTANLTWNLMDPILSVSNKTILPTLAPCSTFVYRFTVANLGHRTIPGINVTVTPTPGYSIPTGATATINYNGHTILNVPISTAGYIDVSSYILASYYPTGNTALPGSLDGYNSSQYSLTVDVPILTGCPGGSLSFIVNASNGCGNSPAPPYIAGCSGNNTTLQNAWTDDPMVTASNAPYNDIQATFSPAGNININTCGQTISATVGLSNILASGGSTTIGNYEYFDLVVPAGFTVTGAQAGGTTLHSSATLVNTTDYTFSGGVFEYKIPSGTSVTAIPNVVCTLSISTPTLFCGVYGLTAKTLTRAACGGSCPDLVQSTANTNLVLSPPPAPTLVVSGSCAPVTITATGACGNPVWTGTPSGATIATNVMTIPNSASGPYTVTASSYIAGCSSTSAPLSGTVYPSPTITASPASQTICIGGTVQPITVTANPSAVSGTFTWSGSSQSFTNSTTGAVFTPTASPSSTQTYTATWTGSLCTVTTTATVNVVPVPAPSISGPAGPICYGGSGATLSASCSGTGITYTWPDGSHGTTFFVNPSATTTYTVSASNGSCSGTASFTVTVDHPSVSVSPFSTSITCGSSITLNANTASGSTYVWSTTATASSVTVSPLTTSGYTVTTTDANGCHAIGTGTVNVTPISVGITPPASICQGNNITLTGTGGTNYTWSTNAGSAVTSSVTVSPTTTTTYTVTASIGSCQNSASTTVTVTPFTNDVLTMTAGSPTMGSCNTTYSVPVTINFGSGGTLNDDAKFTITMPAGYTLTGYHVNGGSAIPLGGATYFVYDMPALTTTIPSGGILLTFDVNTSLCASSISTALDVFASCTSGSPLADFSMGTGSIAITPAISLSYNAGCSGQQQSSGAAYLSVSGLCSGTYTYNWSPVVASSTLGATQSGSGASTLPLASNGTYTVTVNASGCAVSASLAVTGVPSPIAIGQSTSLPSCGTTATLSTLPTVSGGTTPYSLFTWSDGTGSYTSSTLSAGTAAFVSGSSYTLTVTDASGCTATSGTYGSWPGQTQTPGAKISSVISNCLTNLTADWICGTGPYNYLWSSNAGSSATAGVTGLGAGTYSVTITDLGNSSATSTASYTVSGVSGMTATLGTINQDCGGAPSVGSIVLTASDNNSGQSRYYTYAWSSSGGGSSTGSGSTFDASTSGTNMNNLTGLSISLPYSVTVSDVISALSYGTYTVTVTDGGTGCSATASTVINHDAVTTTLTPSTATVCKASTVSLDATTSSCTYCSTLQYQWSGNNGMPASPGYSSTLSVSPTANTSYGLTVTDNNGCTASAGSAISIDPIQVTLAPSVATVCPGFPTTLTATVTGTTGTLTYSWGGGNTTTVSPATTTTYTVTVTDLSTCSATASTTVTVAQPNVYITPSTESICSGGTVTLAATGSAGISSPVYTWSAGTAVGNTVTDNPSVTTNYTVTVSDGPLAGSSCTASATSIVTVDIVTPSLSASVSNLCLGNLSGVTLTAGCPSCTASPFSYAWSGGALPTSTSGTSATDHPATNASYTITVTDVNGCTAALGSPVTVNVIVPPVLTVAPSVQSICYGSAVVPFIASGAISGLTWTGGDIPVLSPVSGNTLTPPASTYSTNETYTLTWVDATGACANVTTSASITVDAAISLATSQTNVSCYGGTDGQATFTPTGGSGTYNYTWSPAMNASSSTGSFIARDLTVNGGSPYSVTVSDGICSATASVTITQPLLLQIPTVGTTVVNEGDVQRCNGKITITPAGGTGSYSYAWNNGAVSNMAANTNPLQCLSAGTYRVTVTDANSCIATASIVVGALDHTNTSTTCGGICANKTNDPSGISAEEIGQSPDQLMLMPNPASTTVEISYTVAEEMHETQIRIYDILGQLIQTIPVTEHVGKEMTDLTKYAAGTYSVVLENNGINISTKRLVKE